MFWKKSEKIKIKIEIKKKSKKNTTKEIKTVTEKKNNQNCKNHKPNKIELIVDLLLKSQSQFFFLYFDQNQKR